MELAAGFYTERAVEPRAASERRAYLDERGDRRRDRASASASAGRRRAGTSLLGVDAGAGGRPRTRSSQRVSSCRARIEPASTTASAAGCCSRSAICRAAWSPSAAAGFGDEQPKYLNSPETPLYTKGNLLYAADLARDDDPASRTAR